MVKNLPSVERSTKIRFGKHVPDSNDQEENTIVFNASNVAVPTPYSNAVYLSPIRNRTDFSEPQVVLLMYDKATKEITESGESANNLVGGATFDNAVNRSNITANVVQFTNVYTSFITGGSIGIANSFPQHTVSVGSNLYIDEFGSNVLVVSGNVAVLGNLQVNGDTTVIYTENTSIKDAFIELGKDNTSGDTTLDLGVLMHRPDALSNVVIGYREGTNEFAVSYTDAKPSDKIFTPKDDEDINVHIYGLTHIDANIYAHKDILVTGNVYVSTNVSVTEELTVTGNVYADKDLELAGNAYVSGNVVASKDLTLSGNTYVSGNVVASKDFTLSGNAYVTGNVNVTKELTATGNVYADKDFELAGNAYVSGNVNVTKQLSVSGNAYISGNVEVTKSLIVSANTHLKGDNVFITHTMDFLDPTTAIVTDQVSNVQIRLGQLENVANTASNPLINQVLTYDQDNSVWSNAYPDQTIVQVKNSSGAPMTRGQAVHVTGSNGNNTFQIELADASDPTKMPAIGIVYEDIPINGQGAVVTFGRANGISGISGYTNGDTLYVASGTPGGLTNVKPYGVDLDLIQNVGVVVNHNSGVMFVTGIGRSNDIPNARIITDYNDMQYVYVNSENNDLKKITSANLNIPLTTAVSSSSNSAANAVTLRGVSITSGDGFHGDLVVAGNVTVDSTTLKVNSTQHNVGIGTASPLAGSNLHVFGSTTTISIDTTGSAASPEFSLYRDQTGSNGNYLGQIRFDGKHDGGNDQLFGKITGKIKTATQGSEDGIIETALVTNGSQRISVRHSGDLFQLKNGTDFEVGEVANLYVDTETSRVGINTDSPGYSLDVRGTANVGTFTTTTGTVTDGTHSTSKDTGVLVLTQGGLGVEANIHSTNVFAASHIAVGTSETSNVFDVRGTANVGALVTTSTHISDDTPATTKTTGALQVTGGVGIQGDIHATHANLEDVEADSVTVTDATAATNKTSGALQVTGGVGVQGDLYATDGHFSTDVSVGSLTNTKIPYANASKILTDSQISQEADGTVVISNDVEISGSLLVGGESFTVSAGELVVQDRIIDIANNNPEHSLDIGILMEHPGHNIGIIHHDTDELTIGYTQAGYGDDHVLWDTSNHITMNVWGHVITQNTVTVEYNDVYIVGGGLGIGIGDRGDGTPDANIHVVGNVFVTSNISTTGNVIIDDVTSATSKTTGALQVAGGVGIQGDIYATNGNLSGDLTVDTNTLKVDSVTNRVGINKASPSVALDVVGATIISGVTTLNDSTASSSKDTGALILTEGGLGVEANIHSTNVFAVSHIGVGVTDGSTTYALDVRGTSNVGIFTTPDATISDSTVADSTTTGALKVTGGISTQANLYVGKDTYITSNLSVDTTTLHVDSISNRVGIGKTDPSVALDVVGDGTFSGDVSGVAGSFSGAVSGTTGTFSGDVSGAAGSFSGAVSGTTGTFSGDVSGAAGSFSGAVSGTTGTFTGDVSGAAGSFSGAVSGTTGTFTGDVSGAAATFDDLTVDGTTLTVDTVNNRVGIGMNNPGFALDVTGDINFSGSLYQGGSPFAGSTWTTSGSDVYYTTGNVGIGLANPSYTLDVNGNINFSGDLYKGGSLFVSTPWTIETGPDALSYTSGNIGIGVANPPAKLTVQGGTIINSDQVAKKTYSYTGTITSGTAPAIAFVFSNHAFSAKITAHLIESDIEISTLIIDVTGGRRGGASVSTLNIAKGALSIFGDATSNPWSSTVSTNTTTVTITPSTNLSGTGYYNLFVEYISADSGGNLTKIQEGGVDEHTFGY